MAAPKDMKPPSSPMFVAPGAPAQAVTPLILAPDDTDDIADPVVPPGTVEQETAVKAPSRPVEPQKDTTAPETLPGTVPALPDNLVPLAHGFCQYVQHLLGKQLDDAGIKMARVVESTTNDMAAFTKGVLASNEHASYQLSDALARLQEHGLPLLSPPYQAVLHVETPAGFGLTLTVTKGASSALIEELGRVESWLQSNGYKPGKEASFV